MLWLAWVPRGKGHGSQGSLYRALTVHGDARLQSPCGYQKKKGSLMGGQSIPAKETPGQLGTKTLGQQIMIHSFNSRWERT